MAQDSPSIQEASALLCKCKLCVRYMLESHLLRSCLLNRINRPDSELLCATGGTWSMRMVVFKMAVGTVQRCHGSGCSFSPVLFTLQNNSSIGTAVMEQGPLCCGENLIWLKEQTETRLICMITMNQEADSGEVCVQVCTWGGLSWRKEISEVSVMKC